jgi:hypothetical protein
MRFFASGFFHESSFSNTTGIKDTDGKFAVGVNYTSGKFDTGINNTSGKFANLQSANKFRKSANWWAYKICYICEPSASVAFVDLQFAGPTKFANLGFADQ